MTQRHELVALYPRYIDKKHVLKENLKIPVSLSFRRLKSALVGLVGVTFASGKSRMHVVVNIDVCRVLEGRTENKS